MKKRIPWFILIFAIIIVGCISTISRPKSEPTPIGAIPTLTRVYLNVPIRQNTPTHKIFPTSTHSYLMGCIKPGVNANLRAGPGTDYSLTGMLIAGSCGKINGRNENKTWIWIETSQQGWVFIDNVELQGEVSQVPVLNNYSFFSSNTSTTRNSDGEVPDPQPTSPPSAGGGGNCDASYPTVCIPPPPPDLDCGQIIYKNFSVLPPDPHRFDRDGDGVGCES